MFIKKAKSEPFINKLSENKKTTLNLRPGTVKYDYIIM